MPASRNDRRRSAARKLRKTVDDEFYQLESLKDYEVRDGVEYFLVKWEGYPDEQNTWEPVTNLVRPTQDLIAQMAELRMASQQAGVISSGSRRDAGKVRVKKPSKKRRIEPSQKSRPSKAQKVGKENQECQEKLLDTPISQRTPVNAEDTSPEEHSCRPLSKSGAGRVSGRLSDPIAADHGVDTAPERLLREDTAVESICREQQVQVFANQENVAPLLQGTAGLLPYLSVVLSRTRTWTRQSEPERVEVMKEKRPLLEVAETHGRALLAYFLRNVRYYKPASEAARQVGETELPKFTQRDVGCQVESSAEIPTSLDAEAETAAETTAITEPAEKPDPAILPDTALFAEVTTGSNKVANSEMHPHVNTPSARQSWPAGSLRSPSPAGKTPYAATAPLLDSLVRSASRLRTL
eukprot:Gregarina_sp_Poly_1__10159@NODE_697_length_6711_cov_200_540036_g525_i0_p3_GENE_NODE_697_length_6711_cov_200_540036_g525_i0NODE_697_length_6711_cov_200_540036_g525_i0_p3_ORF_typecomplete_len410_score66_80Chromo/PF00385_24/1_5e09NESP55/PF06390_12/0_51_NODE_697_length_6711_cov_200_540036_g525_i01591388